MKMSICIKIFYFQTKLPKSGFVANGENSLVLASQINGNLEFIERSSDKNSTLFN